MTTPRFFSRRDTWSCLLSTLYASLLRFALCPSHISGRRGRVACQTRRQMRRATCVHLRPPACARACASELAEAAPRHPANHVACQRSQAEQAQLRSEQKRRTSSSGSSAASPVATPPAGDSTTARSDAPASSRARRRPVPAAWPALLASGPAASPPTLKPPMDAAASRGAASSSGGSARRARVTWAESTSRAARCPAAAPSRSCSRGRADGGADSVSWRAPVWRFCLLLMASPLLTPLLTAASALRKHAACRHHRVSRAARAARRNGHDTHLRGQRRGGRGSGPAGQRGAKPGRARGERTLCTGTTTLRARTAHRLGREIAVSRSSTSMANTRQLRHTRPATHTCRRRVKADASVSAQGGRAGGMRRRCRLRRGRRGRQAAGAQARGARPREGIGLSEALFGEHAPARDRLARAS